MTKFYIVTDDDREFVIDCENAGLAVGMLWSRELDLLRGFSEEQLELVCWSQLRIEPEVYIHHGRRSEGSYYHGSIAMPYLTNVEISLVLQCFGELYDCQFVENFIEGKWNG